MRDRLDSATIYESSNRWNVLGKEYVHEQVGKFVVRELDAGREQLLWERLGSHLVIPLWMKNRELLKAGIPLVLVPSIPILFELAQNESYDTNLDRCDVARKCRDHGYIATWILEDAFKQPKAQERLNGGIAPLLHAIEVHRSDDENEIRDREQNLAWPSISGTPKYRDATKQIVEAIVKLYSGLPLGHGKIISELTPVAPVGALHIPPDNTTTTANEDSITLKDFARKMLPARTNEEVSKLKGKLEKRLAARKIGPARVGVKAKKGITAQPATYKICDLESVYNYK